MRRIFAEPETVYRGLGLPASMAFWIVFATSSGTPANRASGPFSYASLVAFATASWNTA